MTTDVTWKLYYADGSTFSNLDGAPYNSPPWGAIGVVQPQLKGTDPDWYFCGAEFLLWREDLQRWTRVGDRDGFLDQIVHFAYLITAVRPGRMMPTLDFKAEWAKAREEWGI